MQFLRTENGCNINAAHIVNIYADNGIVVAVVRDYADTVTVVTCDKKIAEAVADDIVKWLSHGFATVNAVHCLHAVESAS